MEKKGLGPFVLVKSKLGAPMISNGRSGKDRVNVICSSLEEAKTLLKKMNGWEFQDPQNFDPRKE